MDYSSLVEISSKLSNPVKTPLESFRVFKN